jgi:hypothetical protein
MPVLLNDVKIVVMLFARWFWIAPTDLDVQFVGLFGPDDATVLDDFESSQRFDRVHGCAALDLLGVPDGTHRETRCREIQQDSCPGGRIGMAIPEGFD